MRVLKQTQDKKQLMQEQEAMELLVYDQNSTWIRSYDNSNVSLLLTPPEFNFWHVTRHKVSCNAPSCAKVLGLQK